MSKKIRPIVEHRFYELPADIPAILLQGDKWYISDKKSSRMHFHDCVELGFCHSGNGIIEFDNETMVTLKAGDCTIIPQYLPHTTYSSEGTKSLWSYIFIDFKSLLTGELIKIPDSHTLLSDDISRENCVIKREEFPDVFDLCQSLLKEITQRRDDWGVVFKSTAIALFFRIKRMYHTLRVNKRTGDQPMNQCFEIRDAINYIQEYYMDNITVNELANLCHLSENHFRRLFLAAMGTTPLSYINFMRINQACVLLNTSNQNIMSIANSVGFNSIASFNRNFKDVLGDSPRTYRRRIASKSDPALYQRFIQIYNGWTEAENDPN